MKIRAFVLAATVLFFVESGPAATADDMVGSIAIETPWARVSPGTRSAAAYMILKNNGSSDDQLVKASSTIAKVAELHTHIHEGDVMRMRPVESIDVPAGGTATLQPGGLHIMLFDLSAPLVADSQFPLTLTFARAGETTVQVRVLDVGARRPGAAVHHEPMKMETD